MYFVIKVSRLMVVYLPPKMKINHHRYRLVIDNGILLTQKDLLGHDGTEQVSVEGPIILLVV